MQMAVALVVLAGPLCSQDVVVGARVREWFARYDGAVTADGRPNNGTRFDAASDLGLDDYELAHEIQVSLDTPTIGRFTVGYWRLRLEGDAALAAGANFDGSTFPAGTTVESRLAFDVLYLDYELPLVRDPLRLDFVAGVRYLSGEADLEGGGVDEHANLNRPLLLPGVHVGSQFNPWLRGDAKVEGLAFSAHNVKARYVETEAELSIMPTEGLSLSLGYRQVFTYFKARKDSLNFDLDGSIGGFYLAVGYRF
jgi:hypothetical protein